MKNTQFAATKKVVTSVATGLAVGAMLGVVIRSGVKRSSPPAKRNAAIALGAMGDAMSYIARAMK